MVKIPLLGEWRLGRVWVWWLSTSDSTWPCCLVLNSRFCLSFPYPWGTQVFSLYKQELTSGHPIVQGHRWQRETQASPASGSGLPTIAAWSLNWSFFMCYTAFDCMDHNKLWKVLKEMGIPNYLICFLRNLYVGPEATVRTLHAITDWFKIGNSFLN